MATPVPPGFTRQREHSSDDSTPKLALRGFGRGQGGAQGRGQGRVHGRESGLVRESDARGYVSRTASTDGASPQLDNPLLRRVASTPEQFAGAASAVTDLYSYASLVQGFERAVENNQSALAFKLAACLSFKLPGVRQALSSSEKSRLQNSFRVLEKSFQSDQPPEHRRLLMALITRMACANCATADQLNTSKKTIVALCATDVEQDINQLISDLETHLEKGDTLSAAKQFKTLTQDFRFMLNDEQRKPIEIAVQALILRLYDQARTLPDSKQALAYLSIHLMPHIDFVYLEKPKSWNSRDQLNQILADYLDKHDKPNGADIFYFQSLFRFLGRHHHISRHYSKNLDRRLAACTPQSADSPQEITTDSLNRMLTQGNSMETLESCVEIINKTPAVWYGSSAGALNHIFKCALKAELVGLCFDAAQAQELTLKHCQRLNALLALLRNAHNTHDNQQLWDQPWIIGSLNCNMLYTLRLLFTIRVLKPCWEAIAQGPDGSTTADQLERMFQDYDELLPLAYRKQCMGLKSSQHGNATTQASSEQAPAQLSTQPAAGSSPSQRATGYTASTTAEALEQPLAKTECGPQLRGETGAKSASRYTPPPFFSTPPDRTQYPEINETQLKELLESVERVQKYTNWITKYHLDNQGQALAWMELLKDYYSRHPKPPIRTDERTAFRFLISAVVGVLVDNAYVQIERCGEDKKLLRKVCGQIAGYLAGCVYPLHDHIYEVVNYIRLLRIVRRNFLCHLERAVFEISPNDIGTNLPAVRQACEAVYPYLLLFDSSAQAIMRLYYTQCIQSQLEQALQNIHSEDDEVFTAGVNQLIDVVYNKHNFFSKKSTPKVYFKVLYAARLSYRSLIARMEKQPFKWMDLKIKLTAKYNRARFLHYPLGEKEYYPPDVLTDRRRKKESVSGDGLYQVNDD